MPFDRLDCVLGAGRRVATRRGQQRADMALVGAERRQDGAFHGPSTPARAFATAARRSAAGASCERFRAASTRSTAGTDERDRSSTRTASRRRRRARFRRTAVPSSRVEETAIRTAPASFGEARSRKSGSLRAEPFARTTAMSFVRRKRAASTTVVLGDGETLAPARATSGEDPASPRRLHAFAEAMNARAPACLRLIRALHDRFPFFALEGRMHQMERGSGLPVKKV